MSHPRLFLALVIVMAAASPAAAQSIKPMDPASISRLGAAENVRPPDPQPVRAPAPVQQAAPVPMAQPVAPPVAEGSAHGWPVPEQASPIVAPPAPVHQTITTIPAGSRLSDALEVFITSRGWSLRWLIDEDYMLDADLPIPGADVIDAVTWVVQTYQRQGGMRGVVPRFARGNRVVAIEKMDVRD